MKNIEIKIEKEIPFYDLDPMNVVWHGNYVKYTELVRTALMDKIGYSYSDMYKDNIAYPIAKMDMKFIKSVTLSDKIILCARLIEYEPAIRIKYIFKNNKNEIIFKASTMQICINLSTKESLYNAPEKLKERLKIYE